MPDNKKTDNSTNTRINILETIRRDSGEISDEYNAKFNQQAHDSNSRLEITKLFLKWYFFLIAGSFVFSLVYNFGTAYINGHITKRLIDANKNIEGLLPFLDVSNTVSIITTTLSSGVGFVIGYYFKNKGE